MPLPRRRLDGCACATPLAHFYLYSSQAAARELHPFTTITHLATMNTVTPLSQDEFDIQFLFRRQGPTALLNLQAQPNLEEKSGKVAAVIAFMAHLIDRTPPRDWTERLASIAVHADDYEREVFDRRHFELAPMSPGSRRQQFVHTSKDIYIPLRLEGPYFTPSCPNFYQTVVCLVSGTGIAGALAIAGAFQELERQFAERDEALAVNAVSDDSFSAEYLGGSQGRRSDTIVRATKNRVWKRCVIWWSVKDEEYIELPALKGMLSL
jgi:hypothetical protein